VNSTPVQAVLFVVSLLATVLGGLRWLRVAQREHYLVGSVMRFARRWWSLGPNRLLGGAAVVGLIGAAFRITPAGIVAAVAVACGPLGLGVRGRTSKLAWTRRLRTLAALTAALATIPVLLAAVAGGLWLAADVATLVAVTIPLLVDVAMAIAAPAERRAGRRYVDKARARLKATRPKIVAITGSYGKTTTKGYVTHLVSGTWSVVPSPRSFNNQAGLAKAINDGLVPGTDVFVAEMGTYGPGEIAGMCSWVDPDIAVITSIGPVHLERMGTEERIAAAKAEILERAEVAVLNMDSSWLRAIAERAEREGKVVRRCSGSDPTADVCVLAAGDVMRVLVSRPGGAAVDEIARVARLEAEPTNVACAVAVAMELGVPAEAIARRLPGLPTAPSRRQVTTSRSGATVIDDTYNANPAGAASALNLLGRLSTNGHRRVVVTPGIVELGDRQAPENAEFATAAAMVATELLVVGQTNATALLAGAEAGPAHVVRMPTRDRAVAWVSEHAGPGDVVLYENDLPDHFP
jgi:UDP-N-acetylmuramoyl-tripeptide--D-alanyl-D-alanine ligase